MFKKSIPIKKHNGSKMDEIVKHLVFFHIPRTGGSSVWHALAAIADLQGIPIVDLYHEALVKFSDSSKTLEAVSDRQKLLRARTCLIHHHTEIKIQNYFDNQPLYATIVRDPFKRFVSDIKHLSAIMRSGNQSKEKLLNNLDFMCHLGNHSLDIHSLIDIYSKTDYFRNYYRNWFGSLLLGRNGFGDDEDIKDADDPLFAAFVLSAFKSISCFNDLNAALIATANSFGFPFDNVRLGHLNATSKQDAFNSMRSKYAHYFEKDYAFLESIGFRYKI
jgi:hypothetical protein